MCAGVCVPLLRRYRRLASTARLAFARPGRHATGAARRGSSSSRGCHRGGVDLLDLLGQPRVGQRGQTARDAPSRDSRCGSPPASGTSPPPGSSSSPPRSARRSLLRLAGLPGEKSCCLLQNLALHPQRLILTTQPRELLTLIARETIRTLAFVVLSLLDPIAQRHIRGPRILRDLMLTLARDQNKLDRLPTKLRWIRRLVRGSSAAESAAWAIDEKSR